MYGKYKINKKVVKQQLSAFRNPRHEIWKTHSSFQQNLKNEPRLKQNMFSIPAEFIIPCSRSDPELDNCIMRSFNHLRPYLSRGLPELDIPPVEPLHVDKLLMENNAGAVRVTAAFTNITVLGASNNTVNKVRCVKIFNIFAWIY